MAAGVVEQSVDPALGNGRHVGDDDGQQVTGMGERRAVEVAARLDAPVGQHHGIVDGRAQLDAGDPGGEVERVRAAPCTWGVQRSE